MKRIALTALAAALAVILCGCVTPSKKGRRARKEGKIGGKVSDLIDRISSRAGRQGKTVPVRIRVRPVAPGYMQLICTEDPGSSILLYAYYDRSGKLLEGTYFCYGRAVPEEGAPKPAGSSIIWAREAPGGEDTPAEYHDGKTNCVFGDGHVELRKPMAVHLNLTD